MSMLKRLLFATFPDWGDRSQCKFYSVQIDLDACDGCMLCTVACPAGTLELFGEKGNKKARVIADPRGCISCNNCYAICENHAIKASQHYEMTGYYQTEGIGEFQPPRTSF